MDDWEVENERPEDLFDQPGDYWTPDAIAKLLKAKGQAHIQHRIAARAINALGEQFPDFFDQNDACPLALDVGCGIGFTSDILTEAGFAAVGIDVLVDMLAMAEARGDVAWNVRRSRFHRVLSSATALPFRDDTFVLVASISALQWLSTTQEVRTLSSELARTCKSGACVAIQQYSRSSAEVTALGSEIKRVGFDGGILVDNPESPRKRRVFILARRNDRSDSTAEPAGDLR